MRMVNIQCTWSDLDEVKSSLASKSEKEQKPIKESEEQQEQIEPIAIRKLKESTNSIISLQYQVQEQKQILEHGFKGQQKIERDAATQTNFEWGTELQELSGFTTVFFGPHPVIRDGRRFVRSIQVGDGHVRQLK
uniref:Uncharacterized protein n=1 Tax=Setaria digitata TaxID=48799 RepID=A0A915Q4E2_9BILA